MTKKKETYMCRTDKEIADKIVELATQLTWSQWSTVVTAINHGFSRESKKTRLTDVEPIIRHLKG